MSFLESHIWLGHCSVSAAAALLRERHPYVLLEVDLTYAIFTLESLVPLLRQDIDTKDEGVMLYTQVQQWLRGWHCNPFARYAGHLETLWGSNYIDFSTQNSVQMEQNICNLLHEFGVPLIAGCGSETDTSFDMQPWPQVAHRNFIGIAPVRELPGMKVHLHIHKCFKIKINILLCKKLDVHKQH